MRDINYYQLGASLYTPAVNSNIEDIIFYNKYKSLKSLIICLEDSINSSQLRNSMDFIKTILKNKNLKKDRDLIIFIRPRDIETLKELISFDNIDKIDGFVLAKFDTSNMKKYMNIVKDKSFYIMPILETIDVFSEKKLIKVRKNLLKSKKNILSIRVGSEDILGLLSIRRDANSSLYDIPTFNLVFSNIINIFRPFGFYISSPICNSFSSDYILNKECLNDLKLGLVNKSVIHPRQIDVVQNSYKVSKKEYNLACELINTNKAIFSDNSSMFEKKTHINWAFTIKSRGDYFGVY